MSLLETLKSQHRRLEEVVGAINKDFARGDTAALVTNTQEFKRQLAEHLKLEDAQLYPALREAGVRESAVLATLERFQRSLQKLGQTLQTFLGKIEAGTFDLGRSQHEWSVIVAALMARITAEEAALYPLHEKHCGRA